jgi:hypothetical protein
MTGITYLSELIYTVSDLFNYRSYPVDIGTSIWHYNLFGDRLVSDHDTPRVIPYASAPSTVTLTDRTPMPDAAGVSADNPVTVTFSGPLSAATITGEYLALSRVTPEGAFIERVPVAISYDSEAHTVTLNHAGLVSGSRYRVVFAGGFLDAGGKTISTPALWHFTVADTTGPVLLSSSPEPGCAGMAPGANIILRFDEPVNVGTAAAGILLISGQTSVPFKASGGFDGTLTLTPDEPLTPGTEYMVAIRSDLQDNTGNGASPASFSFVTATGGALIPQGALYHVDAMMGGIHRIHLPDLSSTALSKDSAMNLEPSPDGTAVVLIDMSGNLKALDVASGNLTAIAGGVRAGQTPVFASGGTRILYSKDKDSVFGHEIVSNNMTGVDPKVLLDFEAGTVGTLALSPDGSRLAFTHREGYDKPTRLGVLDMETRRAIYLIDAQTPVWSPDGVRLYAVARTASSGYRNALVELASDLSVLRVLKEMEPPQAWAVSPSGGHLALFLADGIHLVDLGNGFMRQVLACGQAAMMSKPKLYWTRDGVSLVFNATGISGPWDPGAYVLDVAAGKTATLLSVQGGMPGLPMGFQETFTSIAKPRPVIPVVTDLSKDAAASILLDWRGYDDSAGVSRYHVYRAMTPFFSVNGLEPLAATAERTFTDTKAEHGLRYYYAVAPVTAENWERLLVASTGPVVPTDGNLLDDAWEMLWFGSLGQDPGADPDGDGLDNFTEMREGTDPTNADTDGDGALDGEELARGFNPLVMDVLPLTLSSSDFEVAVSDTLILEMKGGSGSGYYSWTVEGTGQAEISSTGVLTGTVQGPIKVVGRDSGFRNLVSNSLELNVLAEAFGISPQSPVALQINGHVVLRASGGSGIYQWTISADAPATLSGSHASCLVSAVAPEGNFEVTVFDLLVPARSPASTTLIIQRIPGDITGDSLVEVDDAILALQVMSGTSPVQLNISGGLNDNDRIGFEEVIYILQKVAGMR